MRPLVAVRAGDPADVQIALRAALDGSGPAILPYPADQPAPAGLPPEVPPPTALVVASSGSTGAPKLVALSAAALLTSAAATQSALGGPGTWLLALPTHYIAGLQVLVRSIVVDADAVALPGGHFSAERFAAVVASMPEAARRYTALVPTQLGRLVERIEQGDDVVAEAVRSLDAILVGGARLGGRLAEQAADAGLRVVRTYGSSETAGGCVYDGVPLAGVSVRIRDGEVQIASPTLADGYLGDAARTGRAFLSEPGRRWYRTGDLGEWDGERLAVSGRLDDVIVSGGEKVSLGAVETVVHEIAGLGEAVVVRAPDAAWGEVPVVVATSADHDLAALRATVVARLGRAAAPSRIVVLAVLPTLPSGKVDRRRLETEVAAHPLP